MSFNFPLKTAAHLSALITIFEYLPVVLSNIDIKKK